MDEIIIIQRQFNLINQQIVDNYPYETGGFFGGKDNIILGVYPIANNNGGDNAKTTFTLTENDIYGAQMFFKVHKLNIMGMYHSHPNGAPAPSKQDMTHFVGPHFGRFQLIVAITPHNDFKKKFKQHSSEPAYQIRPAIYHCPSSQETIPYMLKIIDEQHIRNYIVDKSSSQSLVENDFYLEYIALEEKLYQMIHNGKIQYFRDSVPYNPNSNFKTTT